MRSRRPWKWQVAVLEWPLLLGGSGTLDRLAPGEGLRVVTGTADLVLRREDGTLLVADYKTDDADETELLSRHAIQVRAYREALAAATGREVLAEIWGLRESVRIPVDPTV
jgi:hypothetical protein